MAWRTPSGALRFRGAATIEEVGGGPAFGAVGAAGFEWVNAAALAGGLYLIASRVVHWRVPAAVLAGVRVPAAVFYDGGSSARLGAPVVPLYAPFTELRHLVATRKPTKEEFRAIGVHASPSVGSGRSLRFSCERPCAAFGIAAAPPLKNGNPYAEKSIGYGCRRPRITPNSPRIARHDGKDGLGSL